MSTIVKCFAIHLNVKQEMQLYFFCINYETLGEWGNDISRNTLINTPLLAQVNIINERSEHCYVK